MRDPALIRRAKHMRANPTPAEARLWSLVRARRLADSKFRHQVVIGRYIADFACRIPTMLVIEVDGDSHDYQGQYDQARTRFLERRGYRVLRFHNDDVLKNLEGVAACLREALTPSPLPVSLRSTTLSPEGERGQEGL
jgi:very-short-patch-repair endonuclease